MKLSILILSTYSRSKFLERLMSALTPQLNSNVEVVTVIDDGSKSIGAKRNEALLKSTGEYVCFVDDDDLVSSDYIQKIESALSSNPDCVGIHLLHFNDGKLAGFTYHSLRYRIWSEAIDRSCGFMRYYRNPNHLNPIKRSLAVLCPFPETSWGEDRDFSQNVLKHLKTEEYIREPIYYYLFRSSK